MKVVRAGGHAQFGETAPVALTAKRLGFDEFNCGRGHGKHAGAGWEAWEASQHLLQVKESKIKLVDPKRFRRWCTTLRITGFVDFVHRPEF
jgi:hypothetical protein